MAESIPDTIIVLPKAVQAVNRTSNMMLLCIIDRIINMTLGEA
jgi:hypothetical protein